MKYLCILVSMWAAQCAWAGDLKLEVLGSELTGKTVYVAVYSADHAQDFPMREGSARTAKVTAAGDSVELLMPNFANGEYAVSVFADINGNNKLDTNFFGKPTEPIGASRDAKAMFGPPSFADAVFKIGDGVTPMRIQLH